MSKEELQSLFGKQRCKPEPVEPCKNSTFGCCPDGFNSAEGPFNAGCVEVKTCENTKYVTLLNLNSSLLYEDSIGKQTPVKTEIKLQIAAFDQSS